MPITDIFSKRNKPVPDVFQYTDLPQPFRVQAVMILNDLFGEDFNQGFGGGVYNGIRKALVTEYGRFDLVKGVRDFRGAVLQFVMTAETDHALDTIEVSFRAAEDLGDRRLKQEVNPKATPVGEAVSELNHRFREHGIGFQYESGQIVRADSQYLHAETVKPALHLLQDQRFKGAEIEFLSAHNKYRSQNYEDALTDCAKSFESTIKVICAQHGWDFGSKNTARDLLAVVFEHQMIPNYLQCQFSSLRSLLESGVPTIRNKSSAHGRGTKHRNVPAYLAAYAIHTTAAMIVFLVQASKVHARQPR